MVESDEIPRSRILDISFNQDQGYFAISTEQGFHIFDSYPFKDTFSRNLDRGIGKICMLFRSNILALVGGGIHPKYPTTKVILWDDHQVKSIGELSFKSDVKGVKLRKERIVVVLEQKVYIYLMSDLKLLDAIDTYNNPLGLCAISSKEEIVIVIPGKKKGCIQIMNYDKSLNVMKKAHESAICALAISQDGKMCATASDKGTLIRVFSTKDGTQIQELRRGVDKAEIYCITFDRKCNWLASTSDKGTVHVFALGQAHKTAYKEEQAIEEKKVEVKNPTSTFKFMKGIIPYFNSEWSFAKFRIPDAKAEVAFGPEDKNAIVGNVHNVNE
jgi:WD40 repeat protein